MYVLLVVKVISETHLGKHLSVPLYLSFSKNPTRVPCAPDAPKIRSPNRDLFAFSEFYTFKQQVP